MQPSQEKISECPRRNKNISSKHGSKVLGRLCYFPSPSFLTCPLHLLSGVCGTLFLRGIGSYMVNDSFEALKSRRAWYFETCFSSWMELLL
ncbi:hypothetical protein AFLA_001428 [Aspergillus flavus NRRL3357]|nr:hypothetical protein AFLA_001428 [Aspergillus flavus NRRL3357]